MKAYYEKPEVIVVKFESMEAITDDDGDVDNVYGSEDFGEW